MKTLEALLLIIGLTLTITAQVYTLGFGLFVLGLALTAASVAVHNAAETKRIRKLLKGV